MMSKLEEKTKGKSSLPQKLEEASGNMANVKGAIDHGGYSESKTPAIDNRSLPVP